MTVNTKQKLFADMEDDLAMVDALWGGTKAMREAGKTYLPIEPAETEEAYRVRKNRSTLTNMFKKTINTFAGRIFDDPARIDDAPEFDVFAQNVDREGRDFHRFAYDFARFDLKDGLRFVMIDAPAAPVIEGGGTPTAEDERSAGVRPYWVEVDVRNVIAAPFTVENGKIEFLQFRMMETVQEAIDEFTEADIQQIRVIEPYLIRLYREDKQGVWNLHDTIETSQDFVPVEPVFADRQGFMDAVSPLMDIAWLNVEHWQKGSDQSNILHVARVPILHWAGYSASVDANGNNVDVVVGPNSMAKSADASAKLEYVEHSGKAIEAGRQDLIDIEKRIDALGGEFTIRREAGNVTATERVSDDSGDISELEAFAQNLQDSFTNIMNMTATMMNTKFNGTVYIKTELAAITAPVNVTELVKLRALGDISREGTFEVLNAQWGTELNAETEQERIESEPENLDDGI